MGGDIRWTDDQLKAAGIRKRELVALVRKLNECSAAMRRMGLSLYGSDGCGYLIHRSRPEHDGSGNADFGAIVADAGNGFDGGGW
jgi:hypothetical protein